MDQGEFRYLYDETEAHSGRKTRRKGNLSPTGVLRLSDNKEFRTGDCVLVTSRTDVPYVGVIAGFEFSSEGFMEAVLLWFCRPEDMKHVAARSDARPHELYITWDQDRNRLGYLLDHATVLSESRFEARYPSQSISDPQEARHTFFCRRSCNTTVGLYSDDLDWSQLYNGRETDIAALVKAINEVTPWVSSDKPQFRHLKRDRPQRVDRPRRVEERPVYNYDDDDDDDDDDVDDNDDNDDDGEYRQSTKKTKAVQAYYDSADEYEDLVEDEDEDSYESDSSASIDMASSDDETVSKTVSPLKMFNIKALVSGPSPVRRLFKPSLPKRDRSPNQSAEVKTNWQTQARKALHQAAQPTTMPGREEEFGRIFMSVQNALLTATGLSVFISGTPGTGKTATVRSVMSALQEQAEDGHLEPFELVEINGLKVTSAQAAYEILWEAMSGKQSTTSTKALTALEQAMKRRWRSRSVVVVLDELDQLVLKNQTVAYNLFNWPTLKHSRLVVVAIANTMDLPERLLSNKISSRIGLMRVTFPGYSFQQLKEIVESRLRQIPDHEIAAEAIEFAVRRIAGVSGDARRALETCRRAVELSDGKITIATIQQAVKESVSPALRVYIAGLALNTRVVLCALLAQTRRTGTRDVSLEAVAQEAERLVGFSALAPETKRVLVPATQQLYGFLRSVMELSEAGILALHSGGGERVSKVQLMVGEGQIKDALEGDLELEGML